VFDCLIGRLELANDESTDDVVCMSCPTDETVDSSDSTPCQFVDAQFSPSSLFYVDACLGPHLPRYVLKSAVDNIQRMHLHCDHVLLVHTLGAGHFGHKTLWHHKIGAEV